MSNVLFMHIVDR